MSNSRNFSTLASNVSSGGTISTNVLIGALANSASSNTVYLKGVVDYQNTTISSVNSFAQSAYNSANNVAPQVQQAFNQANNALILAQGAFDSSNTVSSYATGVNSLASSAYNQANTATTNASNANLLAQNAYNNSNTKFSSSGGIISGNVNIGGSLQIDANLTVGGTVTTINANNLSIVDNMIYLNRDANVANPDIGIAGAYNDGTYRHTGFFRDATDGVWKIYDQYLPEPDASPYIDTSNSSFRIADFQANNITAQSISLSRDFKLPVGNTAQRPPSSAGKLYFNNETNKFEGYGTSWGSIGGGALIGDTPPSNPSSGDLWWNSSDGKTYIYYGTTWVQAQPGGEGQYLPLTGGTVTGNITNVGTLTSNNIVSTANVSYSGTLTGGTGVLNIGSGQIYKDASGNVGIGTSSATQKFNVSGGRSRFQANNETYSLQLEYGSGTGQYYIGATNSVTPDLIFSNVLGTEKMRLDSSGNLGLGVTPSNWALGPVMQLNSLSLAGQSGVNAGYMSTNAYYNAGWKYINTDPATMYRQYNGTHAWNIASSNTAGNPITFTQAMTLDSFGRLALGTTSPGGSLRVQAADISGYATGCVEILKYYGSAASPTESNDWPIPILCLRGYGNYGLESMLSFGYSNDSVYQTGNALWNFRLDGVASATSSSSSTNLALIGPGALILGAGTSERARIDSTGVLSLTQGQIKFPATQVSSSDANTLDDYEEGTWTPTDASGASLSLSVQYAMYTKVGRLVTLSFYVNYPVTSSTLNITIGGLPFGSVQYHWGPVRVYNTATSMLQTQASTTTMMVHSAGSTIPTNSVVSGQYLLGTVTYMTNT